MTSRFWKAPRVALFGLLGTLGCSRGSNSPATPFEPQGGTATTSVGGQTATGGLLGNAGSANSGGAKAGVLENDTLSGVFVHLFEWRWPDVARECENFLGPHGFTAVQVSPPSEHAILAPSYYPWWQRYQTVSYELTSRSGTRDEFVDMVQRCRSAGVGIYVDAVLNHMTAQASGTGSAGTKYTKYAYPDLYTASDFHQPVCQIESADYAFSAERVQRCELVGLADLDTSQEPVRQKLAAYLSELLALGVRGFRLDAAKHVAPADLAAILAKVTPRADEQPYYFLEVIDPGGEAVHAADYLALGDSGQLSVTELKYERVGDVFLGRSGSTLSDLVSLDEATWDLLPSARAVVFTNNHDTQRASSLFYQDGAAHDLANVFMLAWPYGYPSVMSSYAFDRSSAAGRDAGPPSQSPGVTRPVYAADALQPSCLEEDSDTGEKGWVCEHRRRSVASMVLFRKLCAGAAVENLWSSGNQLAFSRGDCGFVALNHEAAALAGSFATGLPAGSYCDVSSGDFVPATATEPASCSGQAIAVDEAGMVSFELPADRALVLHRGGAL